MNPKLVSVLFILPFGNSTTRDCTALVSYMQVDTETMCLQSTGCCVNIYWENDSRTVVSFVASATTIAITCAEARQINFQWRTQWIGRIMDSLDFILASDLIPRSLEFPFINPSNTNWDLLGELLEQTNDSLPSFDDPAWPIIHHTYFSPTSLIYTWGLAVKVMLGTIHNGGGSRGFSTELMAFAEQNRDLLLTFQSLLINGGVELFRSCLRIDFEEEISEMAVAQSGVDQLQLLGQQVAHMQKEDPEKFVVSYEDFEPFVALLEHLPKDHIQEICRDWVPNILSRLMELRLTELVIRIGHKCKSFLPLDTREYIANDVLFFNGQRGCLGAPDGDSIVLQIDQTLDDENFFLQSKSMLMRFDKIHFLKKDFSVRFTDSGSYGDGVVREWFTRMFRYIFSPESGFFEYTDDRQTFLRPCAAGPSGQDDRLASFRIIGRVIALAWTHGITVGAPLGHSTLAYMSSPREWDLMRTLEHDDPLAAKILSDPTRFTASGDIPFFGEYEQEVDHSIMVNEANVDEYIYRQLVARTGGNSEEEISRIVSGLHDILPYTYLSFYKIREIADRLRGPPVVDLDQLYQSTSYIVEADIDAVTAERIKEWIWASLRSFNQGEMQDFLEFVSGSRYPPIHGFVDANGGDHWLQIRIENIFESRNPLPMSRTCFKAIYFGLYDSEDLLKQRLVTAMIFAKEILLE